MFFLETVARHGARSLTVNDDTERDALAIWAAAEKTRARSLRPGRSSPATSSEVPGRREARSATASSAASGSEEWQGIGERHADGYADVLRLRSDGRREDRAPSPPTSPAPSRAPRPCPGGRSRGRGGLNLDSVLAKPLTQADNLLRFDGARRRPGKAIDRQDPRPRCRPRARRERAARRLRGGVRRQHRRPGRAPHSTSTSSTHRPRHGRRRPTVTFARYVPKDDRETLSYVTDVETFYEYGPGVKGETNTYENARPLLDGLLRPPRRPHRRRSKAAIVTRRPTARPRCRSRRSSRRPAARSRRRRARCSAGPAQPVAGRRGRATQPATSSGRRCRNDEGKVLVTMRYNEKPVPFHAGCTPVQGRQLLLPRRRAEGLPRLTMCRTPLIGPVTSAAAPAGPARRRTARSARLRRR